MTDEPTIQSILDQALARALLWRAKRELFDGLMQDVELDTYGRRTSFDTSAIRAEFFRHESAAWMDAMLAGLSGAADNEKLREEVRRVFVSGSLSRLWSQDGRVQAVVDVDVEQKVRAMLDSALAGAM